MNGSCGAAAPLKAPRAYQTTLEPCRRLSFATFEQISNGLVVGCTSPRTALSPRKEGYAADLAQVWHEVTRRKPRRPRTLTVREFRAGLWMTNRATIPDPQCQAS